MELKVNEVAIPEKITFNFEELKNEIEAKANEYSVSVYTEDKIKDAKSDRASLNKLKKTLNDERIRREKEYLAPFNEFKGQINEIIQIIDKPINAIDTQIKGFEEKKKEEKKEAIVSLFDSKDSPEFLSLDRIFDSKWLNASVSMKKIEEEIDSTIENVNKDLVTLSNLPEFGFEATEVYKSTLDISRAIAEGQRLSEIQKRKEEHERRMREEMEKATQAAAEPVPEIVPEKEPEIVQETNIETPVKEEPREWVNFSAYLSRDEAKLLGAFLTANDIKIKRI